MITPETPPPARWPLQAISNEQDDELLKRALGDLMQQDQWIDDFIKRLNHTIEDIVRKQ
jgi:hypothetical protein